jgi:hypothetical protein
VSDEPKPAAVEPKPEPGTAIARAAEPKVPVAFGVNPTTFDEGWRMAGAIAQSELAGKYRGKQADVFVAMQTGGELGFTPMQSLAGIAVIGGRGTVWGDAALALVMRSPLYEDHVEYYEVNGQRHDGLVDEDWQIATTCAVCIVKRRNKLTPTVSRFTVAQARKAKLLTKLGPWQEYPDRMLKMKARSWALRDAFPDVLKGIAITEELLGTPVEHEPVIDPVRRREDDLHAFGIDRTSVTRHEPEPEPLDPAPEPDPEQPIAD